MDYSTQSLEEFRKILTKEYTSKGVKPPSPDGEKEKLLFQQWIKGKNKFQELVTNG